MDEKQVVGQDATARSARKAESRRRILEAAREVFFRAGFMAANLDEVAEGAGVAKGTLYRYFDNKAELYVGVLADNAKAFTDRLREHSVGPGTARERMDRLSAFYREHWVAHRDYFQIFWAIDNEQVIGHLPEGVVSEVEQLWEECLKIVDDVLQEGVRSGEFVDCDTWTVANILWTTANGIIQSDAIKTRRRIRRRSLEEVYSEAVGMIMKAIATGASSPTA